jgi:UDP-4-amino-4,6-dideoxy-N-acetyl-beta-L-altrosamine transaminase
MTNKRIPYGRQNITEEDINSVIETLKSDYLTQGPKIKLFEDNFAKYVGSNYAVAVSNGTAALPISAMALGVKPGQTVIPSPITFAATANAVRYCGGHVVFADIDPTTYLLDINAVREILKSEPKGTFSGIIPIDFTGRPVNLEEFKKLAQEFDLWIIEDAAHSPGGSFRDHNGNPQTCGNGKFADLSIFSFHPVKHIAAGEGGMITTNDERLYRELNYLRSHGITSNPESLVNDPSIAFMDEIPSDYPQKYPMWYMEMQELGFNYRITDIQAALANSQLQRADEGIKRRREIAATYFNAFQNQEFIKGQSGVIEGHAYHLYVLEVRDRAGLHAYLRERQIFAQIHYIPTHLMPYYKELGNKEGDLPNAENYYKHCISIPMFPKLTNEEQEFVIETIKEYYR